MVFVLIKNMIERTEPQAKASVLSILQNTLRKESSCEHSMSPFRGGRANLHTQSTVHAQLQLDSHCVLPACNWSPKSPDKGFKFHHTSQDSKPSQS